ncbi:uncharacterized protein C9orf40 homolog [Ascaphus truei]|uniref:uncharacterized protein C9orf40 homolog n=1 Tax=Ascaphus truei TaxID=8439 RepID=UPI003F5ADDCE
MAKRKAELQLVTPHLAFKRLAPDLPPSPTQRAPQVVQLTPRRKRKLSPDTTVPLGETPSPLCDRSPEEDNPTASSTPCKKQRAAESQQNKSPVYKCQSKDDLSQFNSFQYWRNPLPEVDLSEITGETCENKTKLTPPSTSAISEVAMDS